MVVRRRVGAARRDGSDGAVVQTVGLAGGPGAGLGAVRAWDGSTLAAPLLAAAEAAAQAVRALAAEVELEAAAVREQGRRLRGAQAPTWRSGAADAYRARLAAACEAVGRDALALDGLAARLREHAAAVDGRAVALREELARAEVVVDRALGEAEDVARPLLARAQEVVERAVGPFVRAVLADRAAGPA